MDQHARDFKTTLDWLDDAKRKQWEATRKPSYQDPIAATSVYSLGGDMVPQAKPATNVNLLREEYEAAGREYEAAWNEDIHEETPSLEPHNAGNIDQPGSEAYNRFGLGNPNSAAAKRAREGKGDTPPDGVWD